MKIMLHIFLFAICIYLLVVAGIYALQRQLIYHPYREVDPPAHYHLTGFSEYFVPTADHETVQMWYRPAVPGFPTIIYYHGNAFTLGDRADIYSHLVDKGFGLLALTYRGYGKSTGSPSEQGIYIDARTAIHFMTETQHVPLSQIVLYGESLGTGVAVQMATEYDVSAIVLQSPYTSVAARAAELYDYIPVRYLIKDKYYTIDKIGKLHMPILILHGDLDNVIPIAHGKAVFAAANEPKEIVFFPATGHNDFDTTVISEHLYDFTEKYHLITK